MLKPVLSCLALCFISHQALAQPKLELTLIQLLDPDCQGTNLLDSSAAEPGQCIQYQLQLNNLGTSTAQAIQVNLPIPKATQLKRDVSSGTLLLLPSNLQVSTQGEQVLQTQIEKLEAQQQLVLKYSVQVL